MTRTAIYCRISKDDGRALGVERQERENRELAERLDWEVVETFTDNDISAYSGKRRPGFEAMVEAIKDGRVDGVIAWHPDRLTRQPKELETLIDLLDANDVRVATCSAGTYDLTSPAGRMNARIVGATARYESEQKSARIRSQRTQLASSGGYTGGPRPYGFEADGVSHRASEAKVLRDAAEAILDGGSLNKVSAEVGIHRATLRRILLGGRVAGLRVHRGEIVGPASWEGIIDRETWERLRAVLTDPARKHDRPARRYLLSGLCYGVDERGEILGRMISRPDDGTRRYLLVKPKMRSVAAAPLEDFVVEAVLKAFDEKVVAPSPDDAAADAAAAEVVRLEAELAELAELRGREVITMAEWMAARGPLTERLEVARAAVPTRRVSSAAAALFARPGALREAWEAADTFERQREILLAVIERVEVGPGRRGSIFDTERIHVVPRQG